MQYHAEYRCLVGSKMQTALIANAGLGITGAFRPIIHEITWKEGEQVDEARARKLTVVLRNGLNQMEDTVCDRVDFVRLFQR